jgi:hypothetical protein
MTRTSIGSRARVASRGSWIALALLILVTSALAASTWRVYSNTWDEPEHLAAGIELLDRGRYEYDTEHPPIARALMALGPYLAGAHSFGTPPPDGVQEGVDILYADGHYDLYLTLARLGTLPFLPLLLFAQWLWARRLTASEGEALLAVLLLAAVPPLLGHAALATLDVAAAATVLLSLYALQCWLESARWREAAFFGLTAGLAVGSKFSAIPFLVLGFIVLVGAHGVLWWRRSRSAQPAAQTVAADRPWPSGTFRTRTVGLALILMTFAVPLFLAYEPRTLGGTSLPHRFDLATKFLRQEHGLSHLAGILLPHVWLPFWAKGFIEGVVAIKAHNDTGHLSFLLGQLRSTGWWYFYLVALAAKTPLPLLATGPVGMTVMAHEGWKARDGWRLAPALLFVTVLVFASAFSHINIGIRHVLILYPFMALGGAHVLALAWRSLRKMTVRPLPAGDVTAAAAPVPAGDVTAAAAPVAIVGSALLVAVVGWQVSTLWSVYPDYLPYFNEAVTHPERVLVDSDLDWGQDLRRLERRATEIKIQKLNLAYRGTPDLAREPLPPFVVMPPWKPATGWVAISALAKVHDPKGYAWLDAYAPMETIGKTIELYYIPEARQLPR